MNNLEIKGTFRVQHYRYCLFDFRIFKLKCLLWVKC
jgi:hypothetical protein